MTGHPRRPGSALRVLVALTTSLLLVATPVAAAPSSGPGPRPATSSALLPAWDGSIDLYRDGVFTTQKTWLWCTAAGVQIVRNIVERDNDHSTSGQRRYFDWMRKRNRYDLPESAGVDPQGLRIAENILRGEKAVVDGRRKRVLRRQAIVDREHRAAGAERQLTAHHVVRVEVADGPAAAVEEHQRRQDFVDHRAVGTNRKRSRENQQLRVRHAGRFRRECRPGVAVDAARDERRDRVVRRQR